MNSIDPVLLRQIVDYVSQHDGCTRDEVKVALHNAPGIDCIIDQASEGAMQNTGYILLMQNGRLHLGPFFNLAK